MNNKKRISKIVNTWDCEIKSVSPNKSELVFKGNNTTGIESRVTIIVEDYLLPYMVQQMMKIGKERLQVANDIHNQIKNAVNL